MLKKLQGHIGNLATGFLGNILNTAMTNAQSSAMDSGKMASQLRSKSPFEIPAPIDKITADPSSPATFGQTYLSAKLPFNIDSLHYNRFYDFCCRQLLFWAPNLAIRDHN